MLFSWLLLAAAAIVAVSAADFNPRRALLDHLKEKSDCEVPPSPEYLPVKVQVSLKLQRVLDSCPDVYCIKIQVLEMYNWTDPRLKWNPDNYGGIDYLPVDIDHLWLPDVDIAIDKRGEPMRTRFQDKKATVLSSGSVLLIAPQMLKILCNGTVWEESLSKSGSSAGKGKTSSSISISSSRRAGSSDPRQRQLQMRKSSTNSGSDSEKRYTCEFFQTSWYYDTDIVEVIPATPEEQEGRRPSGSHRMNIREGGPSRGRSSSSSSGEDEQTEENEIEVDDESSSYPWDRQSRSQRSQRSAQPSERRARRQNGNNGKNGKTTKKVPFSKWTTTACMEFFEPNENYDVSDFSAYRELNSLPYAPERQWSMVYYRIGIIDKKEQEEDEKKSSGGKSQKKQIKIRQQQTEEEEEEDEESRSEPSSTFDSSNNNAQQSKRDLKQRRRNSSSSNGRKAKQQIDVNAMVQEDEATDNSW